MKKYELTAETKEINGIPLHRIRDLKDFRNVDTGDLGGWIEGESNLDQKDLCWVTDNAQVYSNAKVSGDAKVYGEAWVYENAQVSENAQVYGSAWVSKNAQVSENAQVYGSAWVYGDAKVYGKAWIYDNARVSGNAQVCVSKIKIGNITETPEADQRWIDYNRHKASLPKEEADQIPEL